MKVNNLKKNTTVKIFSKTLIVIDIPIISFLYDKLTIRYKMRMKNVFSNYYYIGDNLLIK